MTQYQAVPIKKLSSIVKIAANCGHMLALERDDIEPLCEWDHERVLKWMIKIGFPECSNIVKYNKING